jgi:uncharacterized protein
MIRTIVLFSLLPLLSLAQMPNPKPNTYINDFTNHLSTSEIQTLNERLLLLEHQTNVQIAILLINDLPPDMEIEQYAQKVGNQWKVGIAHNGLVYIAVLHARRQRLEVASHLEGEIPDVTAKEIIDNLIPFLREDHYYEAMQELITEVAQHLGAESVTAEDTTDYVENYMGLTESIDTTGPDAAALERTKFEKEKAKYDRLEPYVFCGIILFAILFVVWAYRHRKRYVRSHTINGVYMGIGSDYYASTHPSDSDDSGGGGSGFGGFGGSGGGGFSGGGASGSWQ